VLQSLAMARKRPHRDGCGIAHAADLLGGRWALVIIRELLLGPKRFTDLRDGVPDISPNVLSQRLQELEASGLIRRRKLPPPTGARVYELTPWGAELEPVVLALGRWASRSPALPRDGEMGVDSMVLAIKASFDPAAAGDLDVTYGLLLDDQPFRVEVSNGRLSARRGVAEEPDALIRSDPNAMAALVFGGRSLTAATRAGEVEIEGRKQTVTHLLRAISC
jgi:DNA-binding HxlR family transcriptional regulator